MLQPKYWTEFLVGLFLLLGFGCLLILAFKVSGLAGSIVTENTYRVVANFDNIGGLKMRSRVTMAGVKIGEVSEINLDPKSYKAQVEIRLDKEQNNIPSDSSASILTEGLLGSNYISLTPGFAETNLVNGSQIAETHSALVLENLIGQFLFNAQKKSESK